MSWRKEKAVFVRNVPEHIEQHNRFAARVPLRKRLVNIVAKHAAVFA
jgi:hypothetical protein